MTDGDGSGVAVGLTRRQGAAGTSAGGVVVSDGGSAGNVLALVEVVATRRVKLPDPVIVC